MIIVQALLIAGVPASEIRTYPLDEHSVYTIRLGKDEPTTCVFPARVTALEGAGIGSRPDDHPSVLLSYQPGTEFFSLLERNRRIGVKILFELAREVVSRSRKLLADRPHAPTI